MLAILDYKAGNQTSVRRALEHLGIPCAVTADPALLEMAKVYRLPLGKRLRYIWLPGMFPSFCESCIAAMGMCWKSGVSAEVIGLPDHSVGDALYRAKITISTPEVFAWTLVIVLLSATLSTLAAWALRRAKRALCGEVEGCSR